MTDTIVVCGGRASSDIAVEIEKAKAMKILITYFTVDCKPVGGMK